MRLARSLLSKGPSEYSIVARLVYESAQKSGADLRDQEAVEYTKQLQRMTKKRGSSLGQVSHNIAEFLVAHRERVELPQRRSTTASVAKRVPLLDIPLKPQEPKPTPRAAVAPSEPQRLDLNVPTFAQKPLPKQILDRKIEVAKPPMAQAAKLEVFSTAAEATSAQPVQTQPVTDDENSQPVTADEYSLARPRRVSVVEDKPLFRPHEDLETAPVSIPVPAVVTTAQPKPKPSLPKPRLVQQPKPRQSPAEPPAESKVAPIEAASQGKHVGVTVPSLDDWEAQREREIELLKEAQQAELSAKEAAERETLHNEQGNLWIDMRKEPFPIILPSDPFYSCSKDLYFSQTLEQISSAIDAAVQLVSVTRPMPAYILILGANKLSAFAFPENQQLSKRLIELATAHKNAYALKLLKLKSCSAEEFDAMIGSLDTKEIARFPMRIVLRYVLQELRSNRWESALARLAVIKPLVRDPFCSLELGVLRASVSKKVDRNAKQIISKLMTASVKATTHVVGVQHQLAAAKLSNEVRPTGATLIAQGSATEHVYAEMIRYCRPDLRANLLAELAQHGISEKDPQITVAVMDNMTRNKNAEGVFDLIRKMTADGVELLGCHVAAAIRACLSLRTESAVRETLALVKGQRPSNPAGVWRMLVPVMFQLDMHAEIVEIYDLYSSLLQSPTVIAVSIVPFFNSALRAMNREPLTASFAERVVPKVEVEEVTTITTTEVMLEYAKSRNWESAIGLLKTLPTKVNAATMPTLTLQYNCALSAAVQEPQWSMTIFEQMQKYMVEKNSTTYNTVMSSLSKSDTLWRQALEIFGTIPPSTKDSSSFLVAMSILNKHSLWEQSVDVFQRMKATPNMSRPPLVVYELAIGCTHRQSWAVTLRLFQECLRVHGAASVKEIVASRVIRSLESGRRTDDVIRVQKELEKAKKKKKKE